MGDIKPRKQLTYVTLKDGRVLVTEATPKEIDEYLNNHTHIMIEGEGHSKLDIVSYVPMNIDDLEGYILSQPRETQQKIRYKRNWIRNNMGKDMDLSYAKNYVKSCCL